MGRRLQSSLSTNNEQRKLGRSSFCCCYIGVAFQSRIQTVGTRLSKHMKDDSNQTAMLYISLISHPIYGTPKNTLQTPKLEQENKETLAMSVKENIPWGIFSCKLYFSFHLVNMAADKVFESRTFNVGHFRSCFHSPKN